MLGRRGKADPGRHPVRAAPEAAENRFRVCQEQEIETFPKWNVSCRCRMPENSRTPVKVRRRAAAMVNSKTISTPAKRADGRGRS